MRRTLTILVCALLAISCEAWGQPDTIDVGASRTLNGNGSLADGKVSVEDGDDTTLSIVLGYDIGANRRHAERIEADRLRNDSLIAALDRKQTELDELRKRLAEVEAQAKQRVVAAQVPLNGANSQDGTLFGLDVNSLLTGMLFGTGGGAGAAAFVNRKKS